MIDPLFVDVYPGDGKKDWAAFVAAGAPWHGAILKLSQGMDYQYADWAGQQRKAFLSSPRYADDLFDGFYHYLAIHQDGALQADRFVKLMTLIGGERHGTLWGMVDVERSGQRVQLTKQRVVDCTHGFAARYEQITGRRCTLYGGELLRGLEVGGLMGAGRSMVALYGSELHAEGESTQRFLSRTGTDLDHLLAWQYCGDGESRLRGYPNVAPGCGKVDISVLTLPGGLRRLRSTLWAESPSKP